MSEVMEQQRSTRGGIPQIPWRACWLPTDELGVDPAYQRGLQPAIVRRLVERYNPDLAAGLRVGQRSDGTYWVTDGRHRLEAARQLGYSAVYCYVQASDQASEARSFVPLNEGSHAQSLRRFKAALCAQDEPEVLAVDQIIAECGFIVDYEGRPHDPRSFWAVSTALAIYRQRPGQARRGREAPDVPGPERLRRALRLARATWPDKRGAGQSVILQACDMWHIRYGTTGFRHADFLRKVGELDPDAVVLRAHRQSRAHGHNADLWALQEMVLAYNKGRPTTSGARLPLPLPAYVGHGPLDVDDLVGEDEEQEEEA